MIVENKANKSYNKTYFKFFLIIILLLPIRLNIERFGFTFGTLFVFLLFFHFFLKENNFRAIIVKEFKLFLILIISGLISSINSWEIRGFIGVVVIPLFLLSICYFLINTKEEAKLVLGVLIIAIIEYAAIFELLSIFGNITSEAYMGEMQVWRYGGRFVNMGIISYQSSSVVLGTLFSIGFTLSIGLIPILKKKKYLLFISIYFLFMLIFTAARGATFGAFTALFFVLFFAKYFKSAVWKIFFFLFLFLLFFTYDDIFLYILKIFPSENLERYYELQSQGVSSNVNYISRINDLEYTFSELSKNPLGIGFEYQQKKFGTDEAILYSIIFSGLGILGGVTYLVVLLSYLWRFLINIFKNITAKSYSVLGFSLIICVLIGGLTSYSAIWDGFQTPIFWIAIGTLFKSSKLSL